MPVKAIRRHPVFVIFVLAVTALMLGAGVLVRGHLRVDQAQKTDDVGPTDATPVRVAVIERWVQPLRADFHGFLTPYRELSIAARVSGEIVEQWVEISDPVETGQALFKIDDALRSIEHEQAQAAAERAESEYELAAANWRRIESLPDQTSSSMERIRAQMQYRAAKADKQRADALVRESALLLERTTTRSPIDGVVSGIHFRQGEFAQPGQPLLEVIEVDRFKLVAEIEDRDVIWVEAGFPVALSTDALPGERFVGKVGRVYPKSLATSHKFEVEIEVPDPDHRLRPGFFMQGTITHRTHGGAGADSSGVLVVPREAVIRRYGQHLCYVVRSTEEQSGSGQVLRAVRTPVEVLPIPADPRRYELVRGVAEGDRVVTKGIGHLSDETVVRITD